MLITSKSLLPLLATLCFGCPKFHMGWVKAHFYVINFGDSGMVLSGLFLLGRLYFVHQERVGVWRMNLPKNLIVKKKERDPIEPKPYSRKRSDCLITNTIRLASSLKLKVKNVIKTRK